MSCERPIDEGALADYWLGDGDPEMLDAMEDHLLGCADCARRLQAIAAIGEGVRRLARGGVFAVVVTPSYLDRASHDGLRTREYRVEPGGRVDCTVTRDDDLLVARLVGDFRGSSRIDLVGEESGGSAQRIEDVPFDPEARELILCQSIPFVRTLGEVRYRIRLVAPDPGGDRLIGEYTFDHRPEPGGSQKG